jgi:PAS domain S-box-containing protein
MRSPDRIQSNPASVAALVAAASGASVAVLGGLVVAGWLTVAVALIQVLPGLPPMQYNTALGFMICGAALLAATLDLRRPTALLGGLGASIGVATLLENLLHSNFGIDDILIETYVLTGVPDPGRMAPNSALALALVGFALLLLAWGPPRRDRHLWPALFGCIVVALATAALVGYAADVPHAYGWGRFNPMAIHSAIGFSLLGGGVIGLAWNNAQVGAGGDAPSWLPPLSAVAVIAVTLCLWYAVQAGGQPDSPVGTITVVTGLLTAVLLARSLHAGQLARRHARSLETTNQTLKQEMDTRMRAEETMLQLAAIVESSNDAIFGTTLDGMIQNWNHGAERLYGYSRHEILGKHVSLIYAEQQKHADVLRRVATGEPLSKLETVNLTRDGRKLDISMTVSPILDRSGVIVGVSTIARDITDEKILEQMKSDFVGTVSHELRTPLSAVKGFLELVADGEAGPVNKTQREFLDIAVRNSDRLGALINDLLDMNRIEADRLELKTGPVDMSVVLADVLATFRYQAREKGLLITEQIAELPLIEGDKARLIQVFCNLVSNAIKYTPAGEVGITAAAVPEGVQVVVYDTGIGLTAEDQSKLFTKFFRGSNPVVTDSRGTGLGLVIARAILQSHHATIAVESRLGKGTRFIVVLPLRRRPATTQQQA